MIFGGGCHCGALKIRFETGRAPCDWSVRACQCRFCRAHAALSTSDPQGSVGFDEARRGALLRYRFGQRTADFLICRECGVYVGATIETAQGRFGIVNVNALQPIPEGLPSPRAMTYDGESVDGRMARRVERWSPVR